MDDGLAVPITALVVLVALSAFFSASETAYSSLNRVRLKVKADDGDVRAKRAMQLIGRYDDLLSSILVGNNIVNIAAASIATVLFVRHWGDAGTTLSTAVMTVVVLVFGEVTPKSLAKEAPETVAMAVAPALGALALVCTPINWLFSLWKGFLKRTFRLQNVDAITEDELISMVSEAHDDGTLDENESELIRSAIEFDDLEVESILTPRVDLECVPDTVTMEELERHFEESGFSRIPVYHDTVDNIIGVVMDKDFYPAMLRGRSSVEELITTVQFTTARTKISELLRQLQQNQSHIAVVVDEYGGTAGIVTLEDILEELVGEIWDEHDEAVEDLRRQSDGSWLVSGSMSMDDFAEEFGVQNPDDEATVSGWVLSQVGRLPREGMSFSTQNLRVDIAKVYRRRISQLRVVPLPTPANGDKPREAERDRAGERA